MSEVIQSYESIVRDGRTQNVAQQIFGLLKRDYVVELLRARGQRGVIARNTQSVDRCVENIRTMAEGDDEAFIIAAEEDPERVVGVATSIGGVSLRSVKQSIASFTPAFIARGSNALSESVEIEGNQLFAWTEPDRQDELAIAYKTIVGRVPNTSGSVFSNAGEYPAKKHWTIEPVDAEALPIHATLYYAGFQDHSRGYFDDGELKLETVKQSVLYQTI